MNLGGFGAWVFWRMGVWVFGHFALPNPRITSKP